MKLAEIIKKDTKSFYAYVKGRAKVGRSIGPLAGKAAHVKSHGKSHTSTHGVALGCRSQTCCMRLAKNTGRKKSPSGYHRTTFSGYIFATKACRQSDKNLLSSNASSTCPHNMANFGPLTAEIG